MSNKRTAEAKGAIDPFSIATLQCIPYFEPTRIGNLDQLAHKVAGSLA
jgi:hypothetical protein